MEKKDAFIVFLAKKSRAIFRKNRLFFLFSETIVAKGGWAFGRYLSEF